MKSTNIKSLNYLRIVICWMVCFITSFIITAILLALIICTIPFTIFIIPTITTNRLIMDFVKRKRESYISKEINSCGWVRAKKAWVLKKVFRWRFHFHGDYNCWVEWTNDKRKETTYERTKVDEVQKYVNELKAIRSDWKRFWKVREYEKRGLGILSITKL